MNKRLLPMLLLPVLWAVMGVKANAQSALDQLTIQDGVCQIGTAADLAVFAEAVADDNTSLNALLTADINLAESETPNLMIGSDDARYAGIFDGGGHTITYSYDFSANYCGLFSYISDATIRNLRVEGDVVTRGIHYGALIGYGEGEMLVENVVTNVNITGEHSGVTGNGGMIGALYGNITFNNCATLGKMGYPGSSMYCGFVAFATDGVTSTLNNCYTTCELTEGTGLDYCHTFCRGTCQLNNCYALHQLVTTEVQGEQIEEEQIGSGSLCYKLNGDQSVISWTQTLGTDLAPQPGTGSLRVYVSGTLRCDGTEYESNPLTYTNTESYPVIPDHQYGSDGVCTVCGKNADGFYFINSPEQMYKLYLKVQESDAELKVLLTEDIDLNECAEPNLMLGTEARPFHGIFDGAGHTIHYDYDNVTEKWRGLFAFVKDATIRNLRVEGSAYASAIHYGALIGRGDGTILVENVVTDVDITGVSTYNAGGEQGDAGMIGANYAQITFNNCATLGEMGSDISSMYSSFSGWSNSSSSTTLNNCFTTCKLVEGTRTSSCFTLTHTGGKVTLNNCYYLNTLGRVQGTAVAEEQLASGELCYKLNGDQSNIGWYQTLDEDELPVPDASHLRVYGAGNTFINIEDEADYRTFVSTLIEEEKEYYGGLIAQKSLIAAYLESLDGLNAAADIDAFMEGYNALAGQRQNIQSCADAYAAYIAKVEEVQSYLEQNPHLDNDMAQLLRSYVSEYEDAIEGYPHGSAEYILDKCELSEEEIIAETALVDAKLTEAITAATAVGTEITMLFTNADLSDKFNGWEGQVPTGWGTSETSPLYAAECLGAKMDMYQTVTGLPNGIYELRINGAFRPTPYNDFYNTNYAATLYANNIHNFFQANIEGMIDVEEAIDGENCNINGPIADFPIKDEDDEVIGYTMQGIVSCCNAFQADRYPNYVLCKVTDGTLTIGVRQPGTSLSGDWLGFGNIRVFYYGQLDEAEESLDRVLASQSDRARTILNVYEKTIDINDAYASYPNYSQALKTELQKTLDNVKTASTPEAKYQLIEKFSELFLKIYECKQAYITLMDKCDELSDMISAFSEILSEDEFYELEDLWDYLANGYQYGTLSAEEALAVDLSKEMPFLPEQEDGYYLLRTPKDFYVFAGMVNAGMCQINGKLLADIDLRETDYVDAMVGIRDDGENNIDMCFAGVFDGQGHTITIKHEGKCVEPKWVGLFRAVNGATIRNLRVEGEAYPTYIHYGALIGVAYGTVLVENVITNVHITGMRTNVTGDAGMLGANYANITFNNCATLGEMGYPGSSMYSSYSGWSDPKSTTTLNNCYSACSITEGTILDGNSGTLTHGGGTNTFNNCYYLNYLNKKQGKQMTLEQFQNGEVCYKLNGDQSDIHWYQTIGEDPFPILDPSRGIVVVDENGVYTGIGEIKSSEPETVGNDAIYNLAGQRLQKLQKGINIVGQKKVLVK